jgi:hypothetical protein
LFTQSNGKQRSLGSIQFGQKIGAYRGDPWKAVIGESLHGNRER